MTRELPDSNKDDTKDEGPCAICLEEKITNPVSLPCGHVFCFECVGQFQLATKKKEVSIGEADTDGGRIVTAFVPFNTKEDGSISFDTKDGSLCPYCRGEIPNVLKTTIERGTLYCLKGQQNKRNTQSLLWLSLILFLMSSVIKN